MLSLAKASEQYRQYMLGSMQDAVAPAPLEPLVEDTFRSGQFSVTIRELIAYYIAMVWPLGSTAMCSFVCSPHVSVTQLIKLLHYCMYALAPRSSPPPPLTNLLQHIK